MQHYADSLAHSIRLEGWVQAEYADATGSGTGKSLAHVDGGGFASAIGPQEAKDLSLRDSKAQAINGGCRTEVLKHVLEDEGSIESCIHEGLV